jgi:LPXTG-motif cell wall-anchored protein
VNSEIKYTDVMGLTALFSVMMAPVSVNPSGPSLQITAIIIVVVILAIGGYWYRRRRKGGAT